MSGIIPPMVSSSPPPFDDGPSFNEWENKDEEEDDFGDFASFPAGTGPDINKNDNFAAFTPDTDVDSGENKDFASFPDDSKTDSNESEISPSFNTKAEKNSNKSENFASFHSTSEVNSSHSERVASTESPDSAEVNTADIDSVISDFQSAINTENISESRESKASPTENIDVKQTVGNDSEPDSEDIRTETRDNNLHTSQNNLESSEKVNENNEIEDNRTSGDDFAEFSAFSGQGNNDINKNIHPNSEQDMDMNENNDDYAEFSSFNEPGNNNVAENVIPSSEESKNLNENDDDFTEFKEHDTDNIDTRVESVNICDIHKEGNIDSDIQQNTVLKESENDTDNISIADDKVELDTCECSPVQVPVDNVTSKDSRTIDNIDSLNVQETNDTADQTQSQNTSEIEHPQEKSLDSESATRNIDNQESSIESRSTEETCESSRIEHTESDTTNIQEQVSVKGESNSDITSNITQEKEGADEELTIENTRPKVEDTPDKTESIDRANDNSDNDNASDNDKTDDIDDSAKDTVTPEEEDEDSFTFVKSNDDGDDLMLRKDSVNEDVDSDTAAEQYDEFGNPIETPGQVDDSEFGDFGQFDDGVKVSASEKVASDADDDWGFQTAPGDAAPVAEDGGGWAAFGGETQPAEKEGEDAGDEWAAFGSAPQPEPAAAVDDDDEFQAFSDAPATTPTKPSESPEVIISKCFPDCDINGNTDIVIIALMQLLEEERRRRRELPQMHNTMPSRQSMEKKFETIDLNVWNNLKDMEHTNAVRYQWADSCNEHRLLKAVNIDTRNMLVGHKKEKVPIFATGLGLLEPSKGPMGPNKNEVPQNTGLVDTSKTTPSNAQTPIQDIPPAEFDWGSAGLTNPLDAKGATTPLDLDFFSAQNSSSMLSPIAYEVLQKEKALLDSLEPTKPATTLQPLQDILSQMNYKPTTTSTDKANGNQELSKEARKVIDRLPLLSFMHSKILTFPIKGTVED